MKRALFLFSLAAAIAIAGTASAHVFGPNGEGNPWYLPAIDEALVPTIDGDLSDWAFMPDEYIFDLEAFVPWGAWNDDEQANTTRDDWDVLIYGPAWIPATDQLIVAYHIVDDHFYSPDPSYGMGWAEDHMQINTDADHGGDEGFTGQMLDTFHDYQQNYIQPKSGGITGCYVDHRELDWVYEAPYTFVEWSRRDWVEGADGSYDLEWLHQPFVTMKPTSMGGVDASELADWEPGMIVGLDVACKDADAEGESSGYVSFKFGPGSQYGGHVLADWELLDIADMEYKTAVENNSWGRVKAALAQ